MVSSRPRTDPDIWKIRSTRIREFNIRIRICGFLDIRISDIRPDILLPADIRIRIRKNN